MGDNFFDAPPTPIGLLASSEQIRTAMHRVRSMATDPETAHRFEDKIARAALVLIGEGVEGAALAIEVASFLSEPRDRWYG